MVTCLVFILFHDGAGFFVGEVVHLQANRQVVVNAIEDRAVQLAAGIAVDWQLPVLSGTYTNSTVVTVESVWSNRHQILITPTPGQAHRDWSLLVHPHNVVRIFG